MRYCDINGRRWKIKEEEGKKKKIRKMHMKSRTGGEGGAWISSFFQSNIFILAKSLV